MPVSVGVLANWVNGDNEIQVQSVPVRVKAVEIWTNDLSTTKSYVRIWNVANPTPGTTEPDFVLLVPASRGASGDSYLKHILAGGRLDTALSWGVYTTPHSGSTAVSGVNAPLVVKVFYEYFV